MRSLVRRWGHAGFGLASSLVWALPMAVWAGGADLSGTGEAPWIALRVGLAALVVWIILVAWAARVPLERRPRRLELGQMTRPERRAWMAFAAAAIVVTGWLNGAATVDWGLLRQPLRSGRPAPWLLVAALAVVLVAALAVALTAWRRARREWIGRRAQASHR